MYSFSKICLIFSFLLLFINETLYSQDEEVIIMEEGYPVGDLIDEQGRHYFIDTNEQGKFGLTLEYEKETLPYQYDDLEVIEEKYLIAQIGNKKGIITIKGKVLVPIEYQYINDFGLSYWEVIDNQKKGLYDKNGNLITEALYDQINPIDRKIPFYIIENGGMVNLLNLANGKKVFKDNYQELSFCKMPFDGFHLVIVKRDGMYGVIDFHENTIVPFKYDEINFSNSNSQYIDVYLDGKKLYYDLFNRIELKSLGNQKNTIEAQLFELGQAKTFNVIGGLDRLAILYNKDSTIVSYDENLRLKKDDKIGIYNLIQNRIVIPIDYDEIIKSSNDRINECFFLKKDGLYTVISKFNLEPLTNEKFEDIKHLKSQFYFLGCNDGKCSLFDFSGRKLLTELSSFQELDSPLLKVQKSGKFGVFNLCYLDMEIPFSELNIEVISRESLKIGERIITFDSVYLDMDY